MARAARSVRRRPLLAAAVGLMCGCDCESARRRNVSTPLRSRPDAAVSTDSGLWREISFNASEHYAEPQHAAVMLQPGRPLLVALHGAGEARRGLETGARGWRDDYDLERAHRRLGEPPLERTDLLDFVRDERLAQLNASLKAEPYRGLTVACPFTPSRVDRSVRGAQPFAGFVTKVLIPKVRSIASLEPGRATTGIDGVSMGGRLALQIGLSHPEIFGAVGALQPAIAESEADSLADLAARAAARAPQKLRLVSSDGDPFLAAVRALSKALSRKRVDHQVVVTPGPHDYVWNRGPGSFEMLMWHERALRGISQP